MKQEIETIKVFTPDKGCALKVSLGGRVMQYVFDKLYCMPWFYFEIEEIQLDQIPEYELNKWLDTQNILNKLKQQSSETER